MDPLGILAVMAFWWLVAGTVFAFVGLAVMDAWRSHEQGRGWWPWD